MSGRLQLHVDYDQRVCALYISITRGSALASSHTGKWRRGGDMRHIYCTLNFQSLNLFIFYEINLTLNRMSKYADRYDR